MPSGFSKSCQLAFIALFATLALASCGEDQSAGTTSEEGTTPSETVSEPLEAPEAKESIDDAVKRIDEAIESGDCKAINKELNLTSRPVEVEDEEARCEALTSRLGGEVLGAEDFGGNGAVVDYEYGEFGSSAVFVVEPDGKYHLAYADSLIPGTSANTKPAKAFDDAAEAASDALRESDCDAFIAAANRRHGPGAAEEKQICEYVDANPVPALVDSYPELEVESLGANSDYALYSLATPDEHYTMVLGRQEDTKSLSADYEPLPDDAPEYGFVDLILTALGKRSGD